MKQKEEAQPVFQGTIQGGNVKIDRENTRGEKSVPKLSVGSGAGSWLSEGKGGESLHRLRRRGRKGSNDLGRLSCEERGWR